MNKIIRLCDLKGVEAASVKEIYPECRIKQTLLDVGLIPGTRIECLFSSPLGGMKAYWVRGATIAIRNEDCAGVGIEREKGYGAD